MQRADGFCDVSHRIVYWGVRADSPHAKHPAEQALGALPAETLSYVYGGYTTTHGGMWTIALIASVITAAKI